MDFRERERLRAEALAQERYNRSLAGRLEALTDLQRERYEHWRLHLASWGDQWEYLRELVAERGQYDLGDEMELRGPGGFDPLKESRQDRLGFELALEETARQFNLLAQGHGGNRGRGRCFRLRPLPEEER